ncbi:tetratricopeptide repeat protein [Pseudobdellovibrio exovorus]|uniref:O-linked GlcNAc transferase n=1 Tax=Pseudobdellovibrio exovorus JSS TaxID=1184267 RepID=M4VFB2_9BACT|nr:tetratricopeptide repeat protein [Pseudobdellovibrio exovorus]AGH96741.1 O-linked GlcNAc transferase [Pseudobdellovibrio exovorus JSS]
MLKHGLSGLFFIASALFCLDLGHAQTAQSPVEALANALSTVQPIPPPAATTPPPANNSGNPAGGASGGAGANAPAGPTPTTPSSNLGGKYEEHQSICRMNEYDLVKDFSDDLKKRRVELIKTKLKNESNEQRVKTQIRLIKEYLDQKNNLAAGALIQEMKQQKLSGFDNEYVNSLAALSENRISVARQILNKMSLEKENASNVELLRSLAEVYIAESNYYEASTLYEDLNALTKNAYLPQLCEVMTLNTMNAEAERICLQASSRFPQNPFPPIFQGITHRERLDLKQAESLFKKSIAIKPTEMGHSCLAEINFMNKKFTEAASEYKKALEVTPTSNRALLGLAWTEIQSKNYTEAIEAFKKACKLNSKNEVEIRKAFKYLNDEKIAEAPRFIEAVNSCSGS